MNRLVHPHPVALGSVDAVYSCRSGLRAPANHLRLMVLSSSRRRDCR